MSTSPNQQELQRSSIDIQEFKPTFPDLPLQQEEPSPADTEAASPKSEMAGLDLQEVGSVPEMKPLPKEQAQHGRKHIPSFLSSPGPLIKALAKVETTSQRSQASSITNVESSESNATKVNVEEEWKPKPAEWLVMITLAVLSLMISLDATVVVTSLGRITQDLKGTTVQAFWVGTSYLLSCAVVMPFLASLSEVFGRVPTLFSSVSFFTIGSIICCVAHSFKTLLVGRVIQGIGGGGIIVLALVIFTDIVPLRYRPKYYGVIQGAWALGSCIGPLIGGLFAEHTTWRWIFYLMFPFCGFGLIMIPLVVRLRMKKKETIKQKLVRVDWIGGFLFISSLTSFLVAISWGGIQEPWGSFRTIVPLIIGALGIFVAGFWEHKFAKEPFLKRSLWKDAGSVAAYFEAAVQGFILYSGLYYYSFYLIALHRASPAKTGIDLLSITVALVPSSIVVGNIITKMGTFRWALWSGWALTTLTMGLTIIFNEHTHTAVWAVIFVLVGFGNGLLLNTLNFTTQALADKEDAAPAAAMYIFMRSLGMSVGVAIGGSIFQNVLKTKLIQLSLPTEIATNAETYVAVIWTMTDLPRRAELLSAYAYGFRGVFAFLTALSGVAGLTSLLIKHTELNHEVVSGHTLGPVKNFDEETPEKSQTDSNE